MKKLLLIVLLGLVTTSSFAQIFNPNRERTEFEVPIQPPEMRAGYALQGKGLHSAVPHGVPGTDCVVNPVSMQTAQAEMTSVKLVAGQIVEIPVNVLFDFDGDFIRLTGVGVLTEFYEALINNHIETIAIVGHTDSKGSDEYNLELGFRRAAAVASAIVASGFDAGAIEIDSAGESEPKVSNTLPDGSDDPIGRQTNRRVDIEIVAIYAQEIEIVSITEVRKNPQIFHVLGNNNTVSCVSIRPVIGIDVTGSRMSHGGIVITVPY